MCDEEYVKTNKRMGLVPKMAEGSLQRNLPTFTYCFPNYNINFIKWFHVPVINYKFENIIWTQLV